MQRLIFALFLLVFLAAAPRTDFLPSGLTASSDAAPKIVVELTGQRADAPGAVAFTGPNGNSTLWVAMLPDRPGAFIEPIRACIGTIEFVKSPKDRLYATYTSGSDTFALALVYDEPGATILLIVKGTTPLATLEWALANHKPLHSGPPAYVLFIILLSAVLLIAWLYYRRGFRGEQNDQQR